MKILDALVETSIEYARNQVKHGIECFQLFETYGGLIPEDLYNEIFLPLSKKILNSVRDMGIPTIFFPKNFGNGLKYINKDICDFVSVDWQANLYHARKLVDKEVGVQGNIDPRLLYSDYSVIEKELEKLIPFGQENQDWIINLGHGFLPILIIKKQNLLLIG
jgi:uroporphyrinogen decarboxylase